MRKLLIALSAVMLVTVACQKEASLENPDPTTGGGGGNTPTGQLTRMVLVTPTDSLAYNLFYDAAGRLIFIDASAISYTEQVRFKRNASGIIEQIVLKNSGLQSANIDSVVTRYYYNTAKSRYEYGIFELDILGATYIDSTEFVYNTAGNLTSRISHAGGTGTQFEPAAMLEYTQAGANLNSVKSYSYSGSDWDIDYTINYSFDSKINPLRLGIETLLIDPYISPAFGLNSSIYFGANNATVIDYIDPVDPGENYKITTTYSYNSVDKPAGATAVESPGNLSSSWRFYYR
ncbi:hypothetical protein HRH25_05865 [Flavisolibacter sp. BT320]|nr:hypothetical protein [Flavisolibacter longurius]